MKTISILIALILCATCSLKGQLVKHDLPKDMSPDIKYWFSETQLKNSTEFALQTGRTVRRCYIDGVEFTEQGYIKNPCSPKDSKQVARISESDKSQHVIKVIFSHPDDLNQTIFKNSNAQFIKF